MFISHPIELSNRRNRCRPIVDELSTLIVNAALTSCNVCGSSKNIVIADEDRYGFPVRSAMCEDCGLIYLVDRFSQAEYEEFYSNGYYRKIIENFFGVRQKTKTIKTAQAKYTASLIASLKGYIDNVDGERNLLDIGGSTGLTSRLFEQEFGFKATVLEPSAEEAEMARTLGLAVEQNTIEHWETDNKFDVILLCRTFEHLFDLKLAFKKIYDLLTPNGLLVCDVSDFIHQGYLQGAADAVTKIDHCYWLNAESAKCVFAHLGFDVQHTIISLPDQQVGYLLKKMDRGRPIPQISTDLQIQKLLEIQRLWYLQGERYYDFTTWVRRTIYRFRRNLRKKIELFRT